jgi:hypothetical protein
MFTDPVTREALAAATCPVAMVRHTTTPAELARNSWAASRMTVGRT